MKRNVMMAKQMAGNGMLTTLTAAHAGFCNTYGNSGYGYGG